MAASKEETLEQTLHVVANFSKFVEELALVFLFVLRTFLFKSTSFEASSTLRISLDEASSMKPGCPTFGKLKLLIIA